VLNLVPALAPHKGEALVDACRRLRCTAAIFVGDDVTDEDVFRIGPPEVVGIRVGPGRTDARFRLAGQGDVDRLLARLVQLREPAKARGRKRP